MANQELTTEVHPVTVSAESVNIGDLLPSLKLTVNRAQIVRYAGASTDFNPIHWSDDAAQKLGLPGVIAHGMWTMGAALRIVNNWIGDPGKIVNYFVRFTNPLVLAPVDENITIEVTGEVTQIEDGVAVIAIDALYEGTKLLGAAKAQVRLS